MENFKWETIHTNQSEHHLANDKMPKLFRNTKWSFNLIGFLINYVAVCACRLHFNMFIAFYNTFSDGKISIDMEMTMDS